MKIRGAMVDMLLEIDKSYQDYVVVERGQRVLYVPILRAIYGMLMSGLLFYKKFRAVPIHAQTFANFILVLKIIIAFTTHL